jgi:hypothetical protein
MRQTKIDRLSEFAYKDHRARWKFYLCTMAVAISYGCLNTIVLDRPEETVTYEVLSICVLAHVVFLSYYLLRNRSAVAVKRLLKNRSAVAVKERWRLEQVRLTTPWTANWRFPRFLPYAGVVAAMILFAMARVSPNQLEAEVVGFGLTILPSSAVSAHVPTILNGARDHDIIVSPSVLQRTGLRILQDSDKQPAAWSAAKATLDYRSFLNERLRQAPTIANAKEPDLAWPYFFALKTKPTPGQSNALVARVKTDGTASKENSARLESLSSPQVWASGAKHIVIEGKTDTIVLDGEYWKDVIVKDAKVEYDGGPIKLENVYFVNCEFIVPQTPGGRAFANAVLNGGATYFKYPRS